MDILAVACIVLVCGAILLVVGRSFERSRAKEEVLPMKKDDLPIGSPDRRPKGEVQRSPTGQMSNPVVNVLKRVQAKSDGKTDEALAAAARSREARHTAEFNLQVLPFKQHLETQRLQGDIIRAEDEVDDLKRAREERALAEEAARRPAIPSKADALRAETDEIKAEAERLKAKIELERLQREHSKIVNPPEAKRELKPEDELLSRLDREIDKLIRKLNRPTKEQAKEKAKLLCQLNDITDPAVIARFERQAAKVYDDLARGWDEG